MNRTSWRNAFYCCSLPCFGSVDASRGVGDRLAKLWREGELALIWYRCEKLENPAVDGEQGEQPFLILLR